MVEEAKESAAAASAAELTRSEASRRAAMSHNNPSPFRPFTPANNMKRKASSGHKAGSMAALLSSVCDEQQIKLR
jgi:hypothetical protein